MEAEVLRVDEEQSIRLAPQRAQVPAYELRDASKRYGGGRNVVHALREATLTVQPGDFVVVAGPSGSGKSTLLQLLGALDRPTSGQVFCLGRDLAQLSDSELAKLRRQTIGFIFQQFNLIPTLTARANVEVALAPVTRSRSIQSSRAEELLAVVGLANRAVHLPSELSGGEQQRVAIARALANDPAILLADEPTGNLDSTTGEEIVNLLLDLSTQQGRTVIVVTHDTALAANAPRIIRIRDGKLEEKK